MPQFWMHPLKRAQHEHQSAHILEEKLHVGARVPDLDGGRVPWGREDVEAVDEEPQAEPEPLTPVPRIVILHEQLGEKKKIPKHGSSDPRGEMRHKRKHLTGRGDSYLALEEDLGLEAPALLDGEHDPVRRQLHHRVLRHERRKGWGAGLVRVDRWTGEGRGKRASELWADLVALPADGGERVDHAVDAVDLADEVRRVIVAAGRRRAHLPGAELRRPDLLLRARFLVCPAHFSRANE